jgi:hypothetical protein
MNTHFVVLKRGHISVIEAAVEVKRSSIARRGIVVRRCRKYNSWQRYEDLYHEWAEE